MHLSEYTFPHVCRLLTHLCRVNSSTKHFGHFLFNIRSVWLLLLLPCSIEIYAFIAISEDPDQTPRSAASDLGLHCLPVSLLCDAKHKWVNYC